MGHRFLQEDAENSRKNAVIGAAELADFAVFEDLVEHVGEGAGAGAGGVLRVLEVAGE